MPSQYLLPDDYATYGVPTATSQQVIAASAIIDGELSRPDGLIYNLDGAGNPCYMVTKVANLTLTAAQSITAGQNVTVNVNGTTASLNIGDVCIIDRETPNITEACAIISITGNTLILGNVLFNHSVTAPMEFGLVITEYRNAPNDRNIVQASQAPLARLISGMGQYGFPRRGDNIDYSGMVYNAQVVFAYSGGPPLYEMFNVSPPFTYIENENSILYYPTGIYMLHYSKVRLDYIAGWTYEGLPSQIKQACADLVIAQQDTTAIGLGGPIKGFKQGDTEVMFASGNSSGAFTLLTQDTKNKLNPFRARSFI